MISSPHLPTQVTTPTARRLGSILLAAALALSITAVGSAAGAGGKAGSSRQLAPTAFADSGGLTTDRPGVPVAGGVPEGSGTHETSWASVLLGLALTILTVFTLTPRPRLRRGQQFGRDKLL